MSAETNRLQAGETSRIIRIPTGSVTLDGEFTVPEVADGLVIFAHAGDGTPPHPHNHLLARLLRRAGLGTLLFDLLTPDEIREESRGAHLRFNMGLLTQRLNCAAHWVADEDEARHLRIGLLGSGTGSGAALVAAADLGKAIGAVVSQGGRPDLAGNALRRVKTPTLLIAGERDDSVLEFNGGLRDAGLRKHFGLVRGASQSFGPGALEEVSRLSAEWFLEHLRPFSGARFTR